ncbi:OmpA family protein [Tunturiibacter gelidoferens]|uniref:Outer membrane protein OmpA-like peptidoglycan-associated protein n=1 Tax=Tunturiibacter gelidiferens TaxID=3069689 RepID=A0A9X0QA58_9BACT|nr:OmpA family protein [Edaphobacter lichenicola]MBB5326503.1 outer membrane protein OmpA-like peptidoglycan-associated protein [Edaphobacter lichenicola]
MVAALTLTIQVAQGQSQIQGVINGRSGATMTVQSAGSPNTVVLLTDSTSVGEVEGVFKARTKQMPMTALIPGLPVQIKGTLNDQNQFVADTIKFKGSDLKAAMDAQAGLQPTEQKVAANAAQIQLSDQEIAAQQAALQQQQAQLTAEQQKVAANKAAIAAANKRFGELGEYNILGETTVLFANGKITVEPQYKEQLLKLAQQAKGITAYILQVQGYASAVGSAALNQRLSSERANAVTAILVQQGQIPLTNMLAPGAMGTSSQVDSDKTSEGQAENRRVVVRILQNKGVSGN